VKRGDLIRELAKHGCALSRHGGRHDVYWDPRSGKKAPVPRHSEIDNTLVKEIKKQLGIERD
jgi:predicted RNA binding protein YcfA (HicA-like mRNA interferase family)